MSTKEVLNCVKIDGGIQFVVEGNNRRGHLNRGRVLMFGKDDFQTVDIATGQSVPYLHRSTIDSDGNVVVDYDRGGTTTRIEFTARPGMFAPRVSYERGAATVLLHSRVKGDKKNTVHLYSDKGVLLHEGAQISDLDTDVAYSFQHFDDYGIICSSPEDLALMVWDYKKNVIETQFCGADFVGKVTSFGTVHNPNSSSTDVFTVDDHDGANMFCVHHNAVSATSSKLTYSYKHSVIAEHPEIMEMMNWKKGRYCYPQYRIMDAPNGSRFVVVTNFVDACVFDPMTQKITKKFKVSDLTKEQIGDWDLGEINWDCVGNKFIWQSVDPVTEEDADIVVIDMKTEESKPLSAFVPDSQFPTESIHKFEFVGDHRCSFQLPDQKYVIADVNLNPMMSSL